MIEISSGIQIDESELMFDFIRSSGPGGQNVNKVATSAQLRFDVRRSPNLPDEVKTRLAQLAGSRMTADGVLIIEARRYRTQEQNRLDAIHRLVVLIQKALEAPKPRRATRPNLAARVERLEEKRRRGEIKRGRMAKPEEW
jgi:ribosome-associated protein